VERVRCIRCGDIIGVYEPMIVVDEGGKRLTSLAAGERPATDTAVYHGNCFDSEDGDRER
jgi:hypothetical protein